MSQEDLKLADWSLVPDILKILEADYPHCLPICRHLEFYTSCNKQTDAILLTPRGKVNKYGTFVIYSYEHNYSTFYSLNPDTKEMKSLLKSKLIPWDKRPVWGPVHIKFQPALDELYDEENFKIDFPPFIGDTYLMDLDEAKKITYTCPPELYISTVKEEDGEFIESFWPHRGGNSLDVTKFMIKKNGGLGLYLKGSNELIAWSLIWMHLGPGQLFVLDEHKKKGYGTLIAKAVTKFVAEKGVQPACYIHHDNVASQRMFTRIGYQKFFGIRWSGAGPRE